MATQLSQSPGYQTVLWLSTTLWQSPWHGPRPGRGDEVALNRGLPRSHVVRVSGDLDEASGTVLLRMRGLASALPLGVLDRWEVMLADAGWTRTVLPVSVPPPAAAAQEMLESLEVALRGPADYQVLGTLGGQTVVGRRVGGRVSCSPALLARARELVDAGAILVHDDLAPAEATLSGPDLAVILTLMRALDVVISASLGTLEVVRRQPPRDRT